MDIHNLIRWLHEAAIHGPYDKKQRSILRFQHRYDYKRFLREWSKEVPRHPKLKRIREMRIIHALSCPMPAGELPAKLSSLFALEADPRITVHASIRKPAQDRGIPWGIQQIKAPAAWRTTTGHRVKIGVIDTGVDFNHPDLQHSLARGINLITRSMLPHDDNGHGTHIAGTIAAANRLHGMIGVAPRAIVHPVKAFDHNGSAYVSDIILGIDWCVRNRMDLINMSFGMKTRSQALLTAVTNAYNAGVIIVASSGNDGKRQSVDYPARFPQTVAVGATTRNRRIAPFSNRGAKIDIYAPGDKIISSWLNGRYNEMSGTSMATSHVAGAIALLLAKHPGLSPAEIKAILRRSTQPIRGTRSSKITKAPRAGELDVIRMLHAADK
ncbi:S8 family peptidase [Paenibacillus tarimensis]|uniref:S8 family peptidase n=1 Tax=Paenibacillus tarimensis TaxID=416012 RepID=UPI001F21C206|nr:S8 family peptidase [Paenibacillus tarimensis]MCF2945823.1 S8 family peptidase [Paenibacillus tarimensis]